MTRPPRPSPLPILISALLPPSSLAGPSEPLPSPSAAVLGPLPPTSALHFALNWVALSDLPEYEASTEDVNRRSLARALIVTGPKAGFADAIEEDDEDWLREHGGDYGVLHRLKRVDIRYCPTPEHLLLLLTLLSMNSKASGRDAKSLKSAPGLVILWDVARLFMEAVEGDENLPPEERGGGVKQKEEMRFKQSVSLSQYMNVVAAARSVVNHFSSLILSDRRTQLLVLEPSLTAFSSLPILRAFAGGEGEAKMATPIRERRVRIEDGLRWMFGGDAVGLVEEAAIGGVEDDAGDRKTPTHTLTFLAYSNDTFPMIRRRCGRGEWSSASALEAGEDGVEGDRGGWLWDWCTVPLSP